MQGLGFLHLRPTFKKLVRQHDRWKALLTVEIGKAEKLMDKENRADATTEGTLEGRMRSSNMA